MGYRESPRLASIDIEETYNERQAARARERTDRAAKRRWILSLSRIGEER